MHKSKAKLSVAKIVNNDKNNDSAIVEFNVKPNASVECNVKPNASVECNVKPNASVDCNEKPNASDNFDDINVDESVLNVDKITREVPRISHGEVRDSLSMSDDFQHVQIVSDFCDSVGLVEIHDSGLVKSVSGKEKGLVNTNAKAQGQCIGADALTPDPDTDFTVNGQPRLVPGCHENQNNVENLQNVISVKVKEPFDHC